MLRFRSLASSSAGNATLVEAREGGGRPTRVLVDCGLGWRQLQASLAALGLGPADLDAIFLTHEHGDHVGCAPTVSARHGVPIWTSAGTRAALNGQPAAASFRLAADGEAVAIGALPLQPFAVPPDARPIRSSSSGASRARTGT